MKNKLLSLAVAGAFATPAHTQTPAVTAVTAAQPEQCYTDPNAIPLACLQAERSKFFLAGFTDACSQNGNTVLMVGEDLACTTAGKLGSVGTMLGGSGGEGTVAYQPLDSEQYMDQMLEMQFLDKLRIDG